MSNIELSREFYVLDLKLNRDNAMFTSYEWNRFMGRHTDLGMELSHRDYWLPSTRKLSGQYNEKTDVNDQLIIMGDSAR